MIDKVIVHCPEEWMYLDIAKRLGCPPILPSRKNRRKCWKEHSIDFCAQIEGGKITSFYLGLFDKFKRFHYNEFINKYFKEKKMKLKVWEKKEKNDEVYLKLEENDGEVTVWVCDKDGGKIIGGALIIIYRGKIFRCKVDNSFGFDLDGEGRIKLNE